VNEPEEPPEPPPASPAPQESLGWRVLRSAIAPDVLDDGGHDEPLSARGRILFWGTIGVLVVAIAVLSVLTLAK
jgi:hypothetical protein